MDPLLLFCTVPLLPVFWTWAISEMRKEWKNYFYWRAYKEELADLDYQLRRRTDFHPDVYNQLCMEYRLASSRVSNGHWYNGADRPDIFDQVQFLVMGSAVVACAPLVLVGLLLVGVLALHEFLSDFYRYKFTPWFEKTFPRKLENMKGPYVDDLIALRDKIEAAKLTHED